MKSAERLTPAGRDFLLTALNPFPDNSPPKISFPDGTAGTALPGYVKLETTISAPSGVAGNWDCHIGNYPFQTGIPQFRSCHRDQYGAFVNSAWNSSVGLGGTVMTDPISADAGPIFIHSCASGGQTFPSTLSTTPWVPPTGFVAQNLSWDSYIQDPSRIVALGFEVTNTTSELNKQGSVTTYRMPQEYREETAPTVYWTNSTTTVVPIENAMTAMMPPPTLAYAQQMRSAQTWAASEGIYATAVLSQGSLNPFESNSYASPSLQAISTNQSNDLGSVTDACSVNPQTFKTTPGTAADGAWVQSPVCRMSHFDTTGAYFNGLSNSSTLQVVVHVFFETRPAPESTLLVYGQPVAPVDRKALEIYQRVSRTLPPACKVADNASGDWFRKILSFVNTAATAVGTTVGSFIPGVGLVAGAVGAASKAGLAAMGP